MTLSHRMNFKKNKPKTIQYIYVPVCFLWMGFFGIIPEGGNFNQKNTTVV